MLLGLDFPPVAHLVNWPTIWGSGAFAINKVVLLFLLAAVVTIAVLMAGTKKALVPSGAQNLAEMAVDFIHNNIIMQTMGPEGMPYAPFLLTLFTFILTLNVLGLVPLIQMPANARIALPAFMAIVVWLVYNIMGIAKQGPIGYFKHILFPPGVPKALYILVTPINFVSDLFVRPFALAVRLFANMLAGHLILVSFVVLSTALFNATKIGAIAPFALLIALTGFEILVALLQAYIFTILAGVFIGLAIATPDHH
ncbi:MAG: F-type H+-transporting ATPase subunit a [Actinomycetota bacterium]|jgi:F-type H+-transporting ATPase subunit a